MVQPTPPMSQAAAAAHYMQSQNPTVKPVQTPYAEPMPPAVAAAAGDLGDLVRVYLPRRSNSALVITVLVVSILLIWCIFPIYLLWLVLRTPNLNRRLAARRLYVFQQGMVFADASASVDVWRWADVNTVFQKVVTQNSFGVTTGATMKYIVTRDDGVTVRLTNFWTDVEDLGRHVNMQVAAALLPSMGRAVAAGQGVRFGDVTLDRQGVTSTKGGPVPWSDVRDPDTERGYIRIMRSDTNNPAASTHLSKIPNPTLFIALARYLRKSA